MLISAWNYMLPYRLFFLLGILGAIAACQPDKHQQVIQFYRNNEVYEIDTAQSWLELEAYYSSDSVCTLRKKLKGMLTSDENGLSGAHFVVDWVNGYEILQGKRAAPYLVVDSVLKLHLAPRWQIDIEEISPYFKVSQLEVNHNWHAHLQPHLLTDSASYQVNGIITLRDSTRNSVFPAHMSMKGNQVIFQAQFPIAVHLWGATTRQNITPTDSILYFKPEMNIRLKAIAQRLTLRND